MTLQIIHLQAFIAVADALSFTAAAEALHLAPSRLSHRIQEAEEELGTRLFTRSTRRTSITPAGQALLPRAQAIMRELETIEAIFRTSATGAVRIGVRSLPSDFRDSLLANIIGPAVAPEQVMPQPLDSDRQIRMLRTGALDLALVWSPVADEELRQLALLRERFFVAVPNSPKFEALRIVTPKDVIGLRLASTVDPQHFPADIRTYLEFLPLVDRVNPAVEDGLPLLLSGGEHCAFLPATSTGHTHLGESKAPRYLLRPLITDVFITTYLTWRASDEASSRLRPAIRAVESAFRFPEVR